VAALVSPVYAASERRPAEVIRWPEYGEPLIVWDRGAILIKKRHEQQYKQLEILRKERSGLTLTPSKAPQVKPRRADCTARESALESRSLPGIKSRPRSENERGLFLLQLGLKFRSVDAQFDARRLKTIVVAHLVDLRIFGLETFPDVAVLVCGGSDARTASQILQDIRIIG